MRALILSHARELLEQDCAALLRLWPEAPCGIYSAVTKQGAVADQARVQYAWQPSREPLR